jgi:arylsulfatase A-like enzyme
LPIVGEVGILMSVLGRFRKRRRAWIAAAVVVVGGIAVLLLRPWADSVMTVKVTVATDGAPPRVVYRASRLLSEDATSLPLVRAEVDLSPWAGKLIRFEVEGKVGRRGMKDSSTGFVACEAEVAVSSPAAPEGVTPIEFISWQQGREIGAHTESLGPLAFRLDSGGKDRFAFAMKGSLWRCIRPPKSARLRLRLKPVIASALGRPKPYVASTPRRSPRFPVSRPDHPPDVFIYVIDALRADHLGCYGYTRGTSPAIDAFAADATLYQDAYTVATWTRPSVATMLTGIYPSTHLSDHWSDALSDWPVLLPEMLRPAGYVTRGFVTSPNLTVSFGLAQGYDQFIFRLAPADWVDQMVAGSLAADTHAKPAFMFLHTIEPHDPYLPRPQSLRRFDRGFKGRYDGSSKSLEPLRVPYPDLTGADIQHLIDLYDAEISEADQGFARFLDTLKRAGRYQNSFIILTADHGEAFMEHDTLSHAWSLNSETTHVPLIIRFPGGRHAGLRVEQPVSLVDIAPTVLAQVGLEPNLPYDLPGEDLGKYALSRGSVRPHPIFMEVSRWDTNDIDLVAVIDEDGFKRVVDVSVPPHETATRSSIGLWDTRTDPQEQVDLSRKLPVRAAYDEQLIAQWLLEQREVRRRSRSVAPPKVDFDQALRKELEALGYLGGPPKARRGATRR